MIIDLGQSQLEPAQDACSPTGPQTEGFIYASGHEGELTGGRGVRMVEWWEPGRM
jgi:hypothetical protein